MSAEPRPIRVGLLGFGTVGAGAYRMLQDNADEITRKVGASIQITKIGIRDLQKKRSIPSDRFTNDLASIVDDPEIDVLVEVIGGLEPCLEIIERALRNRKHVVTANKELIAKHGSRLVQLARDNSLDMHYEAAVGGGIPLVQPLKHQLAGNDVIKMMGILNGTTNYILSKMATEGAEFGSILAEAQEKGYAEADPTNDIDGFDAVYKLAILASIAFGAQVPVESVHREGIRSVTARDMQYADSTDQSIKLLGIVETAPDGRVLARVHPTLIPKAHPLASVNGVYNALWLHGDFVGDVMFSGRGAGANPTASAVIGDLIDVGRNILIGGSGSAIPYGGEIKMAPISDLETAFYARLEVLDRPKVLGHIAAVFGDAGISIGNMEMRPLPDGRGEIIFMTHICPERDFNSACKVLSHVEDVVAIHSTLRVENA